MKTVLITSFIIFAGLTSFAQNPSAQAALTINIADVKTIEIVGNKEVNINIETNTDFINASTSTGVTTSMPGHIRVSSSGGFRVTAKAEDLTGSGARIPSNKIFLNVTGHKSSANGVMTGYAAVPNFNLNNSPATLLSTNGIGGGTPQTIFDIDYTLKNVENIANVPSGTYTTQVIYTIETN